MVAFMKAKKMWLVKKNQSLEKKNKIPLFFSRFTPWLVPPTYVNIKYSIKYEIVWYVFGNPLKNQTENLWKVGNVSIVGKEG